MVAPISVFPDVGGAFFGSYRQARGQRLQEAAMRAEMAAAQADRQRQAQARASFAALTTPDRVEQVQLDPFQRTTNRLGGLLGNAGVEGANMRYAEERSVPHLTQNQRATEMQALAQSDPNLFAALGEMQSGSGVEIPERAIENIGAAIARGDITWEGGLTRLINAGVSEQDAPGRLGMYVVPPEQDQSGWSVREGVINGQPAMVRVNSRTGEVQRLDGVAPRPRGQGQNITVNTGADNQTQYAVSPEAVGQDIIMPIVDSVFSTSRRAVEEIDRLEMMRDALDADGFYTGGLAEARTAVARFAQGVGMSPEWVDQNLQNLDAAGLFEAIQNISALALRNPESGFGLTGNTSNRDVQFLLAAVPNLRNTPEANRVLIDFMIQRNADALELNQLIRDHMAANGGGITTGLMDEIGAYYERDDVSARYATLAERARQESEDGSESSNALPPPPPGFELEQ